MLPAPGVSSEKNLYIIYALGEKTNNIVYKEILVIGRYVAFFHNNKNYFSNKRSSFFNFSILNLCLIDNYEFKTVNGNTWHYLIICHEFVSGQRRVIQLVYYKYINYYYSQFGVFGHIYSNSIKDFFGEANIHLDIPFVI